MTIISWPNFIHRFQFSVNSDRSDHPPISSLRPAITPALCYLAWSLSHQIKPGSLFISFNRYVDTEVHHSCNTSERCQRGRLSRRFPGTYRLMRVRHRTIFSESSMNSNGCGFEISLLCRTSSHHWPRWNSSEPVTTGGDYRPGKWALRQQLTWSEFWNDVRSIIRGSYSERIRAEAADGCGAKRHETHEVISNHVPFFDVLTTNQLAKPDDCTCPMKAVQTTIVLACLHCAQRLQTVLFKSYSVKPSASPRKRRQWNQCAGMNPRCHNPDIR